MLGVDDDIGASPDCACCRPSAAQAASNATLEIATICRNVFSDLVMKITFDCSSLPRTRDRAGFLYFRRQWRLISPINAALSKRTGIRTEPERRTEGAEAATGGNKLSRGRASVSGAQCPFSY